MRRAFFSILAVLTFMCGLPTYSQTGKGCIGINYVGADTANPFTAEYRTTSTSTEAGVPKTVIQQEKVARDSRGRIRFEKHGIRQPPDGRKTVTLETAEGIRFTVTREEFGTLIDIFDCASGTSIVFQPGLRIATVREDQSPAPTEQRKRAYSAPYIPGPDVKIPPNMVVEQLGTREIQGVSARGVRTTTLGTESDGDWSGKPVWETELWVSDALVAQMIKIDKDERTGRESRSELIEVKREEPDPGLFELPKDCQVNPKQPPSVKD